MNARRSNDLVARPAAWIALVLGLLGTVVLRAGDLSTDWRFEQSLAIPQAGFLKVSLPAETLGSARPMLEDLRLVDPTGREVPYVIERSQAAAPIAQRARSFTAAIESAATVLWIETGLTVPLDSIELATPATDWIKAATVEGSADRATWQIIGQGQPIFRQAPGLAELRVPLAKTAFRWLRVTVDDRRSLPVPFTGATLHATPDESPCETVVAELLEASEGPGETSLRLALPAAHLLVAAVDLDVTDPVFARQVALSTRQVIEGAVRETSLARGAIYRIDFEAVGAVSNQTIQVERSVPTREIVLRIDNQDSPPLTIDAVRLHWRPVHLVFRAGEAGTYRLLLGNASCAAPRYDVAALSANLSAVPLSSIRPLTVRPNLAYRPPATLPTVADTAAPLDTAAWEYRRAVVLTRPGTQELELDLSVLSHAQAGLADLRLLRGTNQVPYVLEAGFSRRSLTPEAQLVPDPKRPRVSRWRLRLSHARLPLARLTCASPTPLFDRTVSLHEDRAGQRGDRHRVSLGSATWRHTPDQPARRLGLDFVAAPETDTLWLETDNGDNPPLQLDRFELARPASRILFKSEETEGLWLYYGHPSAGAARYDLSLMADQLLAAEKNVATLGPEQRLHGLSWQERFGGGERGGPLIWCVLIGVVVALLLVVRRLVPHTE